MENEILSQILTELKELNVRQNSIGEELVAFQEFTMQKFERLEKRFDGLENEQKKINLIIENEIRPSIQALAEGHLQMQGQINQMQGQINQMQGQMNQMQGQMEQMQGQMNQMQGQIGQMQGQINQMQGQIGRIEDKVTWHDDIIFKRVK